jgi:hypothetical protein
MVAEAAAQKPWFVLMMPMHRMGNANTFSCVQDATDAGVRFKYMPHPGDALITRSRSVMATKFLLEAPTPYAIFVDSDILFTPDQLQKVFDDLQRGYDLVGGVYTVRYGMQLAHYGTYPNGGIRFDGSIQEVKFLSTGFMGINKSLLQKMVDQLELPLCHAASDKFRCYPFFNSYPWYFEDEKQWIYMSEDWDFCESARKVGVKPYVDTTVTLGHEGWKVWTMKDLPADRVKPTNILTLPNRAQVEAVASRRPVALTKKR